MIYLVSDKIQESDKYRLCSFADAMDALYKLDRLQVDTETEGLDCFTKALLTLQLGNYDNQYVFDWQSLTDVDISALKTLLESREQLLLWNAVFDLQFLYLYGIYPTNIYDGMIAEQVLFLGYPRKIPVSEYDKQFGYLPIVNETGDIFGFELKYSLQAAAKRWLDMDLDKTIRGQIVTSGLTPPVIEYAAHDVMYLEMIQEKQLAYAHTERLEKAIRFENLTVPVVAYVKFSGIRLDPGKWKAKMSKDLEGMRAAEKALNDWVVRHFGEGKYAKVNYQMSLFEPYDPTPQCTINWKSTPQVITLFQELGINTTVKDKETKRDKDSIEEKLISPQASKFPIIPLFLEYQKYNKVVTTYGENWLKAINPVTHRIHADTHVIGTDTARMSSGGGVHRLNIQNLPNNEETRSSFVAEEGNLFISCDYAG